MASTKTVCASIHRIQDCLTAATRLHGRRIYGGEDFEHKVITEVQPVSHQVHLTLITSRQIILFELSKQVTFPDGFPLRFGATLYLSRSFPFEYGSCGSKSESQLP